MNKFIRLIFLFIVSFTVCYPAIAQTWDWSAQFGNQGNEIINGIEIAESGNYFIAGGFSEMIEIGSITLESTGSMDVFLSKLNNLGEAQWAVGGGSANIDETAGISIDAAGNIIWTGQFWVQGFFGPDTLFAQSSSKAIFLLKYDESGNFLWSKSISGSAIKVINDVVTDSENNIYLTGYFEDSLLLDNTVLVAPLDQNFFILKYDAFGNFIWGHNYGTYGTIRGSSIDVDSNGAIVAGGYFNGKVDFGGFVLQSLNVDYDLFLVKFDPSGAIIWAKEALGVYDDICSSISIDQQNNIYVGGSFIGELSLGNNIQIATPGFNENLFLLKYDAGGSPVWASALNSQQFNDISLGLDIDVFNQTVGMTGYFEGELKLDELSITAESDQFNGFVAAFKTEDGKADWLRLVAGSNQLISSQIAIDEAGNFTVGGYFLEEAYFDNNVLISNGFNDVFVSKMKAISTANQEVDLRNLHFEIFPNPVGDVVSVLSETDVFFIKIYDLHGRVLISTENEKAIDVSNLSPGSYFLQIGNEDLVKNIILIKQ
jgi:hypothetical protein